jgi:hypothetical protein
MVDVDARLMVFSSKRSTHHAFLEGILAGKRYVYDNNVRVTKDGDLDVNRTTSSDEPAEAPLLHVASFERRYRLPQVYARDAYRELEGRHPSRTPTRRVVFLRDPLNTLASTYQVYLKSPYFSDVSYVTRNVRQWSNVARYVLGGMDDETLIYANRFWADPTYRNARLDSLGVSTYRHSDRLSTFGGGGNTYFGDKESAVTPESLSSRYENYAHDADFVALVREHKDLFTRFSDHVGDAAISAALAAI